MDMSGRKTINNTKNIVRTIIDLESIISNLRKLVSCTYLPIIQSCSK
jgi:hypothetical protein